MNRLFIHPYAFLITTALFWGANAVAGKLAIGHVSPIVLTQMRWLFATAILLPFAWPHLARDWPLIRRNLVYLATLGVFGFALFNSLFYIGLYYTSATHASIVQAAMPLIVFFGMFVVFRIRASALQMIGFAVTATGVIITAAHGDLFSLIGLDLNRGDALILLATAIYGLYTVALTRKPQIHWLSMITVLMIAATFAAVPLLVVESWMGLSQWPDTQGWAVIAFTTIFPSIVSQLTYIWGVEMIGANRANLFINLVPVFGAFLAVIILGEDLFAYHVVALALVLCGIALAERGKRSMHTPAPLGPMPVSPVKDGSVRETGS